MNLRSEDAPSSLAPWRRLVLAGLPVQLLAWLWLLSAIGWSQAAEASAPRPLASALDALPLPVTSFGAVELDGWIYVQGGHAGPPHRYSEATQSDRFERLRVDRPSLREELPAGERCQGTALVAARGLLHRIGGMQVEDAEGSPHLRSLASVSVFDPAVRAWRDDPPLPEARSSHDAAAWRERIFVFGGWTLDGGSDDARWLEHGCVLDLGATTPTWVEVPQPFRRRGAAVVATAHEILVLGGMNPEGEPTGRVDAYDPERGAWRQLASFPDYGFGLAAAVIGERVLAAGRTGTLWSLEPAAAAWEPQAELLFPRVFARLVAEPGAASLLALGGSSERGPVAWIERVDVAGADADERPPIEVLEIPWSGRARQRQMLVADGDELFVFGGNTAVEQHRFAPENFVAECWRVDLATRGVTALADLPAPRQTMTGVLHPDGDAFHALGGLGHDGGTERTFDEIWRFDREAGTWTALETRLPRPITQFRALVQDGALWLFGGMDYDPRREDSMQLSDAVPRADLADLAGGFAEVARLPSERRTFGAALLDGRAYLAGGLGPGFRAVDAFEALDLATREWSTLPPPAHARVSPELVALDGKLYLCGGSRLLDDEAVPDPSLEEFDLERGAWRTLAEELPIAPYELQAFVLRGRLALCSTQAEGVLRIALVDPQRLD